MSTQTPQKWSPSQVRALTAVHEWFTTQSAPTFRLFGYAGTGKTTLAKEFAARIRADGYTKIHFAAFTAKAASVMAAKGCTDAGTVHKLIYLPKIKGAGRLTKLQETHKRISDVLEGAEGDEAEKLTKQLTELSRLIEIEEKGLKRPAFTLNFDSPLNDADLVVIDEGSMIGNQMGEDLLSFDVPVLVLGDPGQLPPVGDTGYFTKGDPDLILEEVHRQAEGSPVLKLAHLARGAKPLPLGKHGDSAVVKKGQLSAADLASFDQILVGTNKARHQINAHVRKHLGRTGVYPEPGDRLVCLKNDSELGIYNGSLWNVLECREVSDVLALSLESDTGERVAAAAHKCIFEGKEPSHFAWKDAASFDYGYALTTHKAQGSQWDSVVIVDESKVFRSDARKWLYTAITRAAERVTIITN